MRRLIISGLQIFFLFAIALSAVSIAVLSTAQAAGPRPALAAQKVLPVGTEIDYGSWKSKIENKDVSCLSP